MDSEIERIKDQITEAAKERHSLRNDLGNRLIKAEMRIDELVSAHADQKMVNTRIEAKLDLALGKIEKLFSFWGAIIAVFGGIATFAGLAIAYIKN